MSLTTPTPFTTQITTEHVPVGSTALYLLKGGAGRGLKMMIDNSDLTIFNIHKGKQTEVISLFNLEPGARTSSSSRSLRAFAPSFRVWFSMIWWRSRCRRTTTRAGSATIT